MTVCGKFCLFVVGGVLIAVLSSFMFSNTETEECAVLRRTLLAQQAMDEHREGPIDFPYISLSLVAACGAEAMRMPQPYKMRIDNGKSEADLQKEFFALKKPTVRVRDIQPFNESVEKLLTSKLGAFTASDDRAMPFEDAHECLGAGTCALFFDNTWTYPDIKPMVPTTPGGSLESLLEHTRFGNMFCTNLSKTRMTARLHSAAFHGSVAIQLAGVKRWRFWNPAALDRYGVRSDEWSYGRLVASVFMPFAGMNEVWSKIPHYDVVTGPGDFMYFPSHWTHIVWTEAGWNTMINLRMCFTASTVLQSFNNAMKVHSPVGAFRLLFFNAFQYVVSDDFFLRQIAKSRDRSKLDVGDGLAADMLDEFVKLNMKVM